MGSGAWGEAGGWARIKKQGNKGREKGGMGVGDKNFQDLRDNLIV